MEPEDLEGDVEVITEEDSKPKRPKSYRILLHNDNYTMREYVVMVLQIVFRKSDSEAQKIMWVAHTKGIAAVGIYPYDVANTNIELVEKLGEQYGQPLLCTMEEVEI